MPYYLCFIVIIKLSADMFNSFSKSDYCRKRFRLKDWKESTNNHGKNIQKVMKLKNGFNKSELLRYPFLDIER